MKILVADDSKTSLAMITASLNKLGHEVMAASSGEQAIEMFATERPDFIILDVVMQCMSGFECAKKLREIKNEKWIPIVFLSASVDDDSVSQGIDAGGDDYLTKPVSEITLAAKIKAMQRIADMQEKLYEVTRKLRVLSSTDVLTGIDNRLQFNKTIKTKIADANRYNSNLALLFLDLDGFKTINDHLGHHIGDCLLKEVALRLKSCLRANDFIARLGGDEFAIILSKINNPNDAGFVAQKILDTIQPIYRIENHDIRISCSIGIACFPAAGTLPAALVQHADVAMYFAKELGRNNFQYYTEEFRNKYQQRYQFESALRFALDNHELFMCYQPIFQLRTMKLVGMEALMRWKHPKFGLVMPDVFIPIAEEIGIITRIGDWALRHVCLQAARWYEAGYKNYKTSVNISSRQMLHISLHNRIRDILHETQLPPELLELELTESSVMTASETVDNIIKELSEIKIGISLDDFGTGYSSLNHLKKLPISTLKIDKSFVMDITKDPNDALIVKAIISMGKTLKLNLIAEGIETNEQLQFLIKNNCPEGQGFYLSAALTTEEMSELMQKENNLRKGN